MPPTSTLGQTENDPEAATRVNWLAIPARGRETDLFSGLHRRLVETVAQTLHYAEHMNPTRRTELDIQFHVSFDLPLVGF
jgi:hypothetical protein